MSKDKCIHFLSFSTCIQNCKIESHYPVAGAINYRYFKVFFSSALSLSLSCNENKLSRSSWWKTGQFYRFVFFLLAIITQFITVIVYDKFNW